MRGVVQWVVNGAEILDVTKVLGPTGFKFPERGICLGKDVNEFFLILHDVSFSFA